METSPSFFIANYKGLTGDKRLDARAESLWRSLCKQPSSSIRALSTSRAKQIAYYRLLENDKLTEQGLIDELAGRMSLLADERTLLCIQDTSKDNLCNHKNRLNPGEGLGSSDNSTNATCFKIHPALVLDANSLYPLGFSAVKVFERNEHRPDRFERIISDSPSRTRNHTNG